MSKIELFIFQDRNVKFFKLGLDPTTVLAECKVVVLEKTFQVVSNL